MTPAPAGAEESIRSAVGPLNQRGSRVAHLVKVLDMQVLAETGGQRKWNQSTYCSCSTVAFPVSFLKRRRSIRQEGSEMSFLLQYKKPLLCLIFLIDV